MIEKDMVALSLTASSRVVIARSPAYFFWASDTPTSRRPFRSPIHSYRLLTSTRLYCWLLAKGRSKIEHKTDGTLVFDDGDAIRAAVIDGLGLGFLFASRCRSGSWPNKGSSYGLGY
jgi:DNA-binding transcriptional LysR family regulator